MKGDGGVRRMRSDRSGSVVARRTIGDKGYIIPMAGLLILPLLAMTAFAVDVGAWYAQGQQMQRAADAAALAGVVWVDDPTDATKWDKVARETATKNGYTNNVNGITVDTQKVAANRIRVTISANGAQYFSKPFIDGQRLTRSAVAEYVLPVPLGSPRNYIGTGGLGKNASNTNPYAKENLWAAVSGRCTDKLQGDRIAALKHNGGTGGSAGNPTNNCSGTNNVEFSDENYAYYIELPDERPYQTDVIIYHGNFHDDGSCGSGGYLPAPQPNEFCPGGLDGQDAMPTTFTLYQVDETLLDDNDNPTMESVNGCTSTTSGENGTKTFEPRDDDDPPEGNYTFSPSTEENFTRVGTNGWWRICRIPPSAPGGRYILRVRNQDSTSGTASNSNGSNAFSIVATPAGGSGTSAPRLCDSRTDVTCPRVYAKDNLSIYALGGGTPEFFLAEIGEEHAGKKVRLTLWDASEGSTFVRLRRPTGTNTWVNQEFDWYASPSCSGCSGNDVTQIDTSGSTFNGRSIIIEFTLPADYDPPDDNQWWRIRYNYNSTATDRSTWSVNILGDPVHLVE